MCIRDRHLLKTLEIALVCRLEFGEFVLVLIQELSEYITEKPFDFQFITKRFLIKKSFCLIKLFQKAFVLQDVYKRQV